MTVESGQTEIVWSAHKQTPDIKRTRCVCPHTDLLRRARDGDETAFNVLAQRLRPIIFPVARDILRDVEEAEDMVQEVLFVVHQSLSKYRGEAKLTTWVYQIARNRSLNRLKYLRRRRWKRTVDISAPAVERGLTNRLQSDRRSLPFEAVHLQDMHRLIRRALTHLSPMHQDLIKMNYFEELSYEQIAQRTGMRLGTIKSGLHRARQQLARVLGTQFYDVNV